MRTHFAMLFALIPRLVLADSLVGTVVPPYPRGVTSMSSACITDPADPWRSCAFAIEALSENGELYLYLKKAVAQIEPTKARWLILDRMPYPRSGPGEGVVFAMCERNGNPDQSLIAVVKLHDDQWYTDITKAFRANLAKGRFEAASTAGIRCVNEGWGA